LSSGFEVSGFEVSGFEVSGFEVSGFEVSGFEVSGFEVSGFEVSGFEVSGFEQSGLEQSVLEQSVLEQSVLEQSVLEQSVLEQSVLEQSVLEQSGFTVPVFPLLCKTQFFAASAAFCLLKLGILMQNPFVSCLKITFQSQFLSCVVWLSTFEHVKKLPTFLFVSQGAFALADTDIEEIAMIAHDSVTAVFLNGFIVFTSLSRFIESIRLSFANFKVKFW